jgi:hypothetical protein
VSAKRAAAARYRQINPADARGIIGGALCIAAFITLLIISAPFTTSWLFGTFSKHETQTNSETETARIGYIVFEIENMPCMFIKFDNDTGRFVQNLQPCQNGSLDAEGNPIQVGGIDRIEAIHDAFYEAKR